MAVEKIKGKVVKKKAREVANAKDKRRKKK